MSLGISQVSNVNFKAQQRTKLIGVERYPDYEVRKYETEATTGKKWGVGFASYFVPGLGQAINGQWVKAAGFFFGTYGAYASMIMGAKKPFLAIPGLLAGIGLDIWSIVNAVKNAKSEETQIIPKK